MARERVVAITEKGIAVYQGAETFDEALKNVSSAVDSGEADEGAVINGATGEVEAEVRPVSKNGSRSFGYSAALAEGYERMARRKAEREANGQKRTTDD